ncbi:Hpt domain-containing protein [Deinococcus sp.]|uniref:hybrid sensor histidine kinase/response regulator n=1 Tax=Deinococcus sp. TaxID=47478 RepID=UPI0025B91689|nr:Hpt domain-containing protein [Deinococcus sp.]
MPNSELLDGFLEETAEVMNDLETGVAELCRAASGNTAGHGETMGSISVLAHRISGSSALYGYPQFSTLAGLLERLLDSRPELSGQTAEGFLALLGTVVTTLRSSLTRLQRGENDRSVGLEFTRLGGSQQLQALVKAVPGAFRLRAPHHMRRAPEGTGAAQQGRARQDGELERAASGASGTAPGSTEELLRSFAQQNPDIWEYFAPEVQEHMGTLREQLGHPEEADTNAMFRAAHTIKGSSYMVGLAPLGDFAHRLEDLLGAVREDAVGFTPEVRQAITQGLDLLDDMLLVAEGSPGQLTGRVSELGTQLQQLATGQALQSQPPQIQPDGVDATATVRPEQATSNTNIRVPVQRLDALLDQVSQLVSSRSRLTRAVEQLSEMQSGMQESQARFQKTVRDFEERYLNPDMLRGKDENNPSTLAGQDATQQFDELEFDTYDDLNILSRSITELSADFSEMRRRLSDNVAHLNEENETLGKLMRQLRLDLNQTSRVPFTQATARLRRWARDHEGQFDLTVSGDDILIESTIAQRLVDPLMHLMTNAVHHGLAANNQRLEQGKPAKGQVWVQATEQGHFLEITVADDGQGLNLEQVREKALAKGLRSAQELSSLSDADAARLILLPGLTTAEQVGNVAGRGVGMDVVATSVRQLGGELLIQTEAGVGTAFTLRLPTTQRIMDVLQVQVAAEQWAALPINSVRSLYDARPGELIKTADGTRIMIGGHLLPVIDVCEIWGWEAADAENDLIHLALISHLSGDQAVRVGQFGRIEEVSVTPPGALLSYLDFLSGLTVSGSGAVLPVLDPAGLSRLSERPTAWLSKQQERPQEQANRRLLLVDDSLSVRRLVGRMLSAAGYQVVTASDGQEAYDLLQQDAQFDGVITDLEMPRMNGYELLTALRNRPATARLPIMIMTTRAGQKHQHVAFQLGANDYFTKPVNELLLTRRLAALLGRQETVSSLGGD